jgi:hypothetical protein
MRLFIDEESIAPRPCATQPPQFPATARALDEGTITTQGFGQQPVDVVPFAFTGPNLGGGEQANYRYTGGDLASHFNNGIAQAWPVQGGQFFPGVWDGGQFGQRASSSGWRGATATLFPTTLGLLVNGSTTPQGISSGGAISISGTLSLSQSGGLSPSNPSSPNENVTISVRQPGGATVVVAPTTLSVSPTNPELFTFTLQAPNAGASPFNDGSGVYTFTAAYGGDLINQPASSNSVPLNLTLS